LSSTIRIVFAMGCLGAYDAVGFFGLHRLMIFPKSDN